MGQLIVGDVRDALELLPSASVQCCVTSPPYFGLRDYGNAGQIGLEATPAAYVSALVAVFRDVRRVLKNDGVLWLNLGDSYASKWACSRRNIVGSGSLENGKRDGRPDRLVDGLKEKDLIGIPWRVAFALQADGWYLRQDIIWHKPNPMPESVRDRCTKAHEYLFMLTKRERYFYDADAIAEPLAESSVARLNQNVEARTGTTRHVGKTNGNFKAQGNLETGKRNKRSVWTISTRPFKEAHFATFPPALVEPCILASSRPGDTALDPFFGAGTTGLVAQQHGRDWIGVEINPAYAEIARARLAGEKIERVTDKQAGHGRRHAGFNERYFGKPNGAAQHGDIFG